LNAVPKRGMCSTIPAIAGAPDALISGNGKMYVEVFGNPFAEQIVFHQERLVTPGRAIRLKRRRLQAFCRKCAS
jgi:hypothetical protein